jgi:divalent anion:Na+ symporter, DASS family
LPSESTGFILRVLQLSLRKKIAGRSGGKEHSAPGRFFLSPAARLSAIRWTCVLLPGLALYFAPIEALTPNQRHLLAFFTSTIVALVVRPLPMTVSVLVAMTLLALTGTLSPAEALSGFAMPTVWLIFSAFIFAYAVTQTQLGLRIAYFFISRFGHTSLSLGYSLALSNLALATVVPSDTARGGGVMAPLVRSISHVLGSDPGPTAQRIGAYLTFVAFHTNYAASAMFLTSMVGNPVIAEFARQIAGVDLSWARWALASSVPGLCTFILVPWLIHQLCPPQMKETEHARAFARTKLEEMGPMTRTEGTLLLVLMTVIAAWITQPLHGVSTVVIALTGLCALLLLRVLTWEEVAGHTKAWDAVVWFAPLLMMAKQLSERGVIDIVFGAAFERLEGWPWAFAFAALAVSYLYAHYGFASMTAHASALYPGFLGAALVAGVPGALASFALAFLSSLNAGITHYGTGSAPIYFAPGYISQDLWWLVGFIISILNLAIWLGIGPIWWDAMGLW